LLGLLRIPLDQALGQPLLHRKRDELLLCAVVEVAFQPVPFLVLGRTRRCLEARSSFKFDSSSAVSRTFRRTRPAWEARSFSSLSSVGDNGSFGGLTTDRAPSSSPW